MPWLDKGFIFDRNEIVNERREPDAVSLLRFGNIRQIARGSPRGSERDHDISRLHRPLEITPLRPLADPFASRGPDDRKKKPRMAD